MLRFGTNKSRCWNIPFKLLNWKSYEECSREMLSSVCELVHVWVVLHIHLWKTLAQASWDFHENKFRRRKRRKKRGGLWSLTVHSAFAGLFWIPWIKFNEVLARNRLTPELCAPRYHVALGASNIWLFLFQLCFAFLSLQNTFGIGIWSVSRILNLQSLNLRSKFG